VTIVTMDSLGWVNSTDAGFITSSSLAIGMATALIALTAHKISKLRLKRVKLGSSEIELFDEKRRHSMPFAGEDRRHQ